MVVYHGGTEIIINPNVEFSKWYPDFRSIADDDVFKSIDMRLAMDIYYRSLLCKQIHNGENGIQYLDYKYLAEDLIENEKELF